MEEKYHLPEDIQKIFPLPLHKEFFNQLQDRLHTCVERVLFLGDPRFTIILNVIPRDEEQQYDRDTECPALIYGGCETQRALMEKWGGEPDNEDYKKVWKELNKIRLKTEEGAPEGSTFYEKIRAGQLTVGDFCKINRLEPYFDNPANITSDTQKFEYGIISPFFDIKEDLFVSVPLIGYTEFDGVAHIVFKKDLLELIPTKKQVSKTSLNGYPETMPYSSIKQLILAFVREYDGLFLDWDVHGENLEKITATNFFLQNIVKGTDEYFGQKKNPILKELELA